MRLYLFYPLLAILSLASVHVLPAQCDRSQYTIIIPLVEQDLENREYESAIQRLLDVRDICPEEKDEINALIKRTFSLIEGEKKQAESARTRAELSESQARTSEKRALASETRAREAERKADSALQVANRVLDQMYFYKNRFGMTLKEVNNVHKFGFIDKTGHEVIPFVYEEATPFSIDDGYARVKKKGILYLLDTALVHYPLANGFKELTKETIALVYPYNPFGHSGKIPEKIAAYPQLEILIAYASGTTKLPNSFTRLSNLKRLDLSWNFIEVLPESFGNLSSLEYLDASNCSFQALSESFCKLPRLRELTFENNRLESLPKNIGQLSQLRILNLNSNFLERLPASIAELSQLQTLDLSENVLENLPESIGMLGQLDYLSLRENDLEKLPASIGQLTRLRHLDLRDNSFPEEERQRIEKLLPDCNILW
ncbi:MAG: WG repeat-containing protein [Bacteroidota bacterium]